jgi:hypothetical protein
MKKFLSFEEQHVPSGGQELGSFLCKPKKNFIEILEIIDQKRLNVVLFQIFTSLITCV